MSRSRIKLNSRVSTEAWRCDIPKAEPSARWSYSLFGQQRVFSVLFESLKWSKLFLLTFIIFKILTKIGIAKVPTLMWDKDKVKKHSNVVIRRPEFSLENMLTPEKLSFKHTI